MSGEVYRESLDELRKLQGESPNETAERRYAEAVCDYHDEPSDAAKEADLLDEIERGLS